MNGKDFKGRTILLDIAFNKKDYDKSNNANKQKNSENVEEPIQNNEGPIENEIIEEKIDINNEDNIKENTEEIEQNQEATIKKNLKNENLENTVFFANIPFDISEEDFVNFGKNFGQIYFAKV